MRLPRMTFQIRYCEHFLPIPLALLMIHYAHIFMEREVAMTDQLNSVGQQAIEYLGRKHTARERALPKSRTAIRFCANSIRAAHRQEFEAAETLLAQAGSLIAEMTLDLQDHQDIFYAGFVQD